MYKFTIFYTCRYIHLFIFFIIINCDMSHVLEINYLILSYLIIYSFLFTEILLHSGKINKLITFQLEFMKRKLYVDEVNFNQITISLKYSLCSIPKKFRTHILSSFPITKLSRCLSHKDVS